MSEGSKTNYVRTSERLSFKTCRWAWERGFVDNLRPAIASPALRFGDLIHRSLAAYYKPGTKRGPKPHLTFRKLYKTELAEATRFGFRDEDGKWHEAGELGEVMLKGYHEEYHERDLRYKVIASEATFRWIIKDPETGLYLCTYVGTFDGIWEDLEDGLLLFPEHKTTKAIEKNYEHLELDEQAGSYWTYGPPWLVKRGILKKKDVGRFKGILYNYMRKGLPDERPRNAEGLYLNKPTKAHPEGEVSKNQPSPLFHRPPLVYREEEQRRAMHERIIAEAREMLAVKEGELEAYKNPGPMFMPNCRGCGYRDICLLHESGHDWEAMRDATMEVWDPYKDHLDPHGDLIR